ncbi:MAG: hypothetical protein KJO44_03320, partial [Gemmatimonadetes bacterium]|nr:hypothetical protein [Gemmatimonadota bacterium]
MRKSFIGLVVTAIATLAAGAAQATIVSIEFSNAIGLQSPGVVVEGDRVTAGVGDFFEISIIVDNSAGDAVTDLFTFVNVDPGVVAVPQLDFGAGLQTAGVGFQILDEGGLFGQSIDPLAG